MKKDLSVMVGETTFNFRVAGLIEFENKILLHKPNDWDFWNIPGGRVKTGEATIEALKREMKEELDLDIIDMKLVRVAENFFTWNNRNTQELLFVYKVKLDANYEIVNKQDFCSLDNLNMKYHWFEKNQIKDIKCLPKLIYNLAINSEKFDHIIEK